MFGFNKTQPTTSGLSTSISQPNFFGQSTAGAGTTAQPATSGGLFSSGTTAAPATTGGLFGASSATTTTSSPFSFAAKPVGTAAPTLSASTSFGGGLGLNKPATTTTTSSPFGQPLASGGGGAFAGFGNKPATTTGTSLFGATPSTGTTGFSGFGGGTTTGAQPSTGIFGSTTQQQQSGSIFSLGSTPAKPATGIFTGGGSLLGGQPVATTSSLTGPTPFSASVQPTQQTEQEILINSLVNPQVFNDERDAIVAKWNHLQAFIGAGKIFYQNAAIDVPKENPFNRLKTIGYSCRPTNKNEDGLVALTINKKEADLRADQKSIVAALHKIFNSEPALSVVIESIKPTSEDKSEVVFYVTQRVSQLTDQTTRIASSQVYAHLSKQEAPPSGLLGGLKTTPTIKQQLEQIGVISCYPLVGMSDDEVKSYLDNLPLGVNPVLWDQAKKNNPNTKKLIPVQIVGFQEINKRFRLQDDENKSQKNSLNIIVNSIESLNDRNKILRSKIDQFKARNEDLEQRTLKVMINYEIRRKIGFPLQENEKYLLGLLESIQMELSSPINKEIQRQKLNEFVDIINSLENRRRHQQLQHQQQQQQQQLQQQKSAPLSALSNLGGVNEASYDSASLSEIQRSLREQQKAFKSLIEMIQKDSKDLEIMRKSFLNEK